MPRGITPRQPARSGRQEGIRQSAAKKRPAPRTAEARPDTNRPRTATRKVSKKAYNPTSPERIHEVLTRLDKQYPDVTCALQHKSAWELLVATILSAQSTDVRVNIVTPELFRKFPTPKAMSQASQPALEELIRSTGFYRNKAKSILGAAKKITNDFGGKV